MPDIRLFDHVSGLFRWQPPIALVRNDPEPDPTPLPEDEAPAPISGGSIVTADFASLSVGASLPGWTARWANTADWSVVEDASALSGKAIRCTRGVTSARRLLTLDSADTMPDRQRTQVCAMWRASSPSVARVGVRLSGASSTVADGYLGGASSNTQTGFTRYAAGVATNTNISQTITANSWYVTVVDDDGASIRHKTWLFGSVEPSTWAPIQADATTAPGWVGLFVFDATGTTDFGFLSVATGGRTAPRPQAASGTNFPPTAEAGPSQSVNVGGVVTLNGSGTDSDGTIASYAWTQTSGTAVTLSSPSVASPTFTAPASASVLQFSLTVTDNLGATGTDTVTVAVAAAGPIVTVASRGPNGTHWPPATPAPWAAATFTVATLEAAVARLVDCSGGETIVVTGTSAAGAGTTTKTTLSGGSMSWANNVLIRGASLDQPITGQYTLSAHHVTLSGFRVTGELSMLGTDRSFIARTVWASNEQWLLNSTRDSGLYECVIPVYGSGNGDDYLRVGGSTGTGWVGSLNLRIEGCYMKGKFLVAAGQHCDTIQTWSPDADAIGTTIKDSVLFTSADKIFQGEDGQVQNMSWINVWGNSPANSNEPVPTGASMGPYGQSVSAPGSNFLFEDCTIIGSINHKSSTTLNTGTFRNSEINGGTADDMNNPTLINHQVGGLTIENRPPPALANLSTIWGQ